MNLKNLKTNWEGFAKTDPMWSILTVKRFSKNKWDKDEFFNIGELEIKEWFERFNELENVSSARALDFGCGVGRLTQALCQRFTSVTGVDISETMIALANEYNKFPLQCNYRVNDQPDLSLFEDNSFDFICSHITLQHIPKTYIFSYIDDFIRIAKPGGIILFSLPSSPPFLYKVLSAIIPNNIKNLLRKILFNSKYAMEMHWVKKTKIENFFRKKGVEFNAYPDRSAGQNWEGYFYLAVKNDISKE
jgi:2-polyprenyl-3-methyl-5-hydroxy-6-metoxy-1,4-benzoquinol methylase